MYLTSNSNVLSTPKCISTSNSNVFSNPRCATMSECNATLHHQSSEDCYTDNLTQYLILCHFVHPQMYLNVAFQCIVHPQMRHYVRV